MNLGPTESTHAGGSRRPSGSAAEPSGSGSEAGSQHWDEEDALLEEVLQEADRKQARKRRPKPVASEEPGAAVYEADAVADKRC